MITGTASQRLRIEPKSSGVKRPAERTGNKRAPAKAAPQRGKVAERYAADGARVLAAHAKHKGDWPKIAKACGMSVGKAQRM